jgi:rare lipoprotein A
VKVSVPPPPSIAPAETPANSKNAPAPAPASPVEDAGLRTPVEAKPLITETGLASWYGGVYDNRRGSNGEIYNMHAMTAAHRTLPLGSVVRVTNLKTERSAVVRITDRGPFVRGRILDLSEQAAKQVDVWVAGVAMVRLDVLHTPVPLTDPGRWAVQIGGFGKQRTADQMADRLSRRYQTAKVHCFSSPVGNWWVRVRVQNDDRGKAEEIVRETQPGEGGIFLVRLD